MALTLAALHNRLACQLQRRPTAPEASSFLAPSFQNGWVVSVQPSSAAVFFWKALLRFNEASTYSEHRCLIFAVCETALSSLMLCDT